MFRLWVLSLAAGLGAPALANAEEPLQLSVYATAGDVRRYLATAEGREKAAPLLQGLGVSRLFLEGRRGDEYVPPETLAEVRDFFAARKIRSAGGIATVPGGSFGKRQNEALDWLNWEDAKTRRDVAGFFTENAPLFGELIMDDFFCTADTSPASARARGERTWAAYRRDLLVSLIKPSLAEPARAVRPAVRLIVKFPQWYDRFHLFGYDPPRMAAQFDQVWVGTEVRNPRTRQMGFVQPTEGYMNFRWLASIAGQKVVGAWFDHIECSAQDFVNQAYGSVLAGARELTLFHLGDLVEGHPGDALLARRWPELKELAGRVRGQRPQGIAFYKPPNSDADENCYLMDYLGMIGLPIVPVAQYPESASVAFLGVQAAADPAVGRRVDRHLRRGATLVFTPAFVRRTGLLASRLAGVELGPVSLPAVATEAQVGQTTIPLMAQLEVDASLRASDCQVLITASVAGQPLPLLTVRRSAKGRVLVLNVRTFAEQDYRDVGEWLLAPKPRGLPEIPQALADRLREPLLGPIGLRLEAPAGVALCLFAEGRCLYNFRDHPLVVRLNGERVELGAYQWHWQGSPGGVATTKSPQP
jgi:hypothetical protein